jgi:hypothetical protein
MPPNGGPRIDSPNVWQRTLRLFGVTTSTDPSNQPSLNLGTYLGVNAQDWPIPDLKISQNALNVTGGGYIGISVPSDETWAIHGIYWFKDSGTYNVTWLNVKDPVSESRFVLETYSGATSSTVLFGERLPVYPEWELEFNIGSFSGAGYTYMVVYYEKLDGVIIK